jgi:ubiquinone/menaquinone biosynthesis C-methylase UbiE
MSISDKRFERAQESERDGWDRLWKGNRDNQANAKEYWQYYTGLMKKQANLKPGDKVLDIGCGPCGMISYLDQGQRYGLDPLIDFYLSNFDMPEEVKWEKGCGEEIPFKDSFFDIVITTNAIDHTQNPQKFMSEINRVLKEHGFLFLTVNTYSWHVRAVKVFVERMDAGDPAHPYTFTAKEVKQLLDNSGFKIVRIMDGIGDLGFWVGKGTTVKESTVISKIKANCTRAAEIRRKEGYKRLLKALISFTLLFLFRAYQWPYDSIFLALKESPLEEPSKWSV